MINENPLVSVIVAAYNAEKTIKQCLKSIQQQTYKNIEIIIVNDGSSDETDAVCRSEAEKDKRIKYFKQRNKGVSAARNAGMSRAEGKYIMFVDADDEIGDHHVESYLDEAVKNNADVVIGGYTILKSRDQSEKVISSFVPKIYNETIWNEICEDSSIFGYAWNKMIRVDLIREHDIKFNEHMSSQEDLDFYLSYYKYCSIFSLIYDFSYYYHFQSGKRTPPLDDFIRNQLKLINTAESIIRINDKARNKVNNRITGFIYGILYEPDNYKELRTAVDKLNCIAGLKEYLKLQKLNGRNGWIAKQYIKGNGKVIYGYFKLRKKAGRMIRRRNMLWTYL